MTVHRLSATRALVTPSTLARILHRRTAQLAEIRGGIWCWQGGGYVGREIERQIEAVQL